MADDPTLSGSDTPTSESDINLKKLTPPDSKGGTIPPSDQYPDPLKTERGQELQKNITESQEMLRQQQEATTSLQKRLDQFSTDYQAGLKQIQAEISQADKERAQPPQLLPMHQMGESALHARNQIQWSWPNTLLTLGVALAGMAGKHGHGSLSGYFLGSFLQAYAAGQQERQKTMLEGWTKTNEDIYKENQQRISDYRAKLSDERLSLDSKIQIMKSMADQFKDLPMQKALETQNINVIKAQLSSYQKGLNDYLTNYNRTWRAHDAIMKSSHVRDYDTAINAMFFKMYGRQPISDQELDEIRQNYTQYDFLKDQKKFGTDMAGRPNDPLKNKPPKDITRPKQDLKPTPTPSQTPAAKPSPTPSPSQPDDLDSKIKEFMSQNMKD